MDFILRAVNDALTDHFGASITDEGVHVLDPFTGTGTFIVRLLQSGLISPEDLLRKYTQELHANEILLMAYYIAAINIEGTFHALQQEQAASPGQAPGVVGYEPFDGIVLTDTFQMTEDDDVLDTTVFTSNSDRVTEQNALDIRVIIGNPPFPPKCPCWVVGCCHDEQRRDCRMETTQRQATPTRNSFQLAA